MKIKKKATKEERTKRATERQEILTSVPEIWDQLSDLYNYYDDKKDDPEARKMISLIETAMAMTHDNPEYYTQFDTLHEVAIRAARNLFRKDPGLKSKYLLDPEDIAHETILHLLERPADYNPNHPGRAGFIAGQVKFEMLSILREEAKDRDAKRWLAEFLSYDPAKGIDPAKTSEMNSMKMYASYFKEMVRLEKDKRKLKKQQMEGQPNSQGLRVKLSPDEEAKLIERVEKKNAGRGKGNSSKTGIAIKKSERRRAS